MTEEKIQQFLNWLKEYEAKKDSESIYVEDYSWYDRGEHESIRYIREMFTTAFREELE